MVEQKTIELKSFEIKKFRVSIKGKTDLLMHGKTDEWVNWYEEERNRKKAEKKKESPKEEVERGTYKDEKGNIVIPSKNVFRMLKDSYGALTGNVGGYKKQFESSVTILPLDIPLKFKTCDIDKSNVNIGFKIPDVRYRNRFSDWELSFEVALRTSFEFDEERFFTILKFAGDFIGLCDGRTIGFGRFEIKK